MSQQITRRALLGGAVAAAAGGVLQANAEHAEPGTHSVPPRHSEFVLRGGYVLSVDPTIGDLSTGDVHVRNGVIVAVGPNLQAGGSAEIDAKDMIVMPGLVDTHWHLWNSAMRPFILDGDDQRGYFNVTNVLGPYFTPADTYRATRLGLVEGVASGITTVHDWSHNVRSRDFADASIRALLDAGVRGRFSYGYAQGGALDVPMDVAGIAAVQQHWFSKASATRGLLHLGVASRNIVPGQSPRGSISIELAHQDWDAARELGLPITLHASPVGLVSLLHTEGLLGPDVQLVHPTQTTGVENEIAADQGVAWSTAPLGETGREPAEQTRYFELEQSGARLGISVDSSAVDSADLFNAMRVLYKTTVHRLGSGIGLTQRRMVELATIEGARSLGLGDVVGSLTPGKRADIVLVNRLSPNLAPPGDPVTQLVSLAQPSNVDSVIVDGRFLLWHGSHVGVEVSHVLREAGTSAAQVAARAGWPT
ncbi:amidohydrolase family protein [Luteimicrobium sp. DT211]|uniref:amidohydrolase family protein n=1 Tax=Luteimicrobium sp. DT211 TaxID=3393412 RepID=UPI003CF052C9